MVKIMFTSRIMFIKMQNMALFIFSADNNKN